MAIEFQWPGGVSEVGYLDELSRLIGQYSYINVSRSHSRTGSSSSRQESKDEILSVADQLGPLLQAARKSAGLSQTALAQRLGISQSRLSAMELNPASINLAQLLALCSALGLELRLQTRADGHRAKPEW